MRTVREIIDDILHTVSSVVETAANVNKNSISRKNITEKSGAICGMLSDENEKFTKDFLGIKDNLSLSMNIIEESNSSIVKCTDTFSVIVDLLTSVKIDLNTIESEIVRLTGLVDEIKNDTDDIFSLALNASIVSSKYSNTSGVFDILSNKLNEMSNFITQNLENIVQVVRPITEGISRLIDENDTIMTGISKGISTFSTLPDALENQKTVISKLTEKGLGSAPKVKTMASMIKDLKDQIEQMDNDAKEAISGSSSVRQFAESLEDVVSHKVVMNSVIEDDVLSGDVINSINDIKSRSLSIVKTATNVNSKSRNQLTFTEGCLKITNETFSFSNELKETAVSFNSESEENDAAVGKISEVITELVRQLESTESKILSSNDTIQAFNEDYKKIDNIIEFLKNILKSMHLIGMYSRIESARDIEQYQGFMNISGNISKLQLEIQNNIPKIETNIADTHTLINKVNRDFKTIYADFSQVTEISNNIIKQLNEMIEISGLNQKKINDILDVSENSITHSDNLRKHLNSLTEVVRIPIEGSAANMERGKHIGECCEELLKFNE